MEDTTLLDRLREQAMGDYTRWLAGEEVEQAQAGPADQGALSPRDLLAALAELTACVPPSVEYQFIYWACVLNRSFPALQAGIQELSHLQPWEMEWLLRFSRILLNAGCCHTCIRCCNLCLDSRFSGVLLPEQHMELLFARSKSQRNLGEYQAALDDLRTVLLLVEQNETIRYLKGAVLIRIGKVYSQFLMMMSVSLCFLREANDQLKPWLDTEDLRIRRRVRQEYAICLDSMGQYWQEKGNVQRALDNFQQAQTINEELGRRSGVYRTESHIIMAQYPNALNPPQNEQLEQIARRLKRIVRKLQDDYTNQRGLAVRQLHLAEIEAQRGAMEDARYWLSESKKMARLYRDDKTQVKRKIVELKYHIYQGKIDRQELHEMLDLVRTRNYYGYEIKLHEAIIQQIRQDSLSKGYLLNSLSRSRTLYLLLSGIAQESSEKIADITGQARLPDSLDEFSCLSEANSKELLANVVHDYDMFIKKMNEIIDQLLQITDQRSKDLNKAILAEAKASLASGVLHDLKHMISIGGDRTCLDDVLEELRDGCPQLPEEKRSDLMAQIRTVNQNLKEKIFPRILEATRVPNDFNTQINVLDVFSEVCQLRLEDSYQETAPVVVECEDELTLLYNREIFFNLIKEMYRNALDYHNRTPVEILQYKMQASGQEEEMEIRILTHFREKSCARQAACSIARQLGESNEREDGFGIRALRGFMQFKTGGACAATVVCEDDIAGICFSVPRK